MEAEQAEPSIASRRNVLVKSLRWVRGWQSPDRISAEQWLGEQA